MTPDDGRIPDPRGLRVSLAGDRATGGAAGGPSAGRAAAGGIGPLVVEPPAIPLAPAPRVTGRGLLGGTASVRRGAAAPLSSTEPGVVLVDGEPRRARLRRQGAERAILEDGTDRVHVLLLPAGAARDLPPGVSRREVVVDGWRFEVDVEFAARAALRERARRGRAEVGRSGPTEVHAIIPGVVVSVSVAPGDAVTAGQQLLVVEAMKMQNELRAPRDGTIDRVAVAAGRTIEVGDLLLVIS